VVFPVLGDAPEKEVFEEERCQALLQSFFARRERYEIVHKNLYTVHQRIAGRFRVGRVFLAGDAAHINNPLGGMGLNFGIHDALNAAEKIGKVWRREAGDDLFDLYDRQRRTVAQEYLLAQTAQNKRDLEEKDPVSRAKAYEKWRRSAADPERTRDFLMRTAMFDSVRRAGEIS
jgi:3-(3-hydroxy-phenyl)propionate hydroxylase